MLNFRFRVLRGLGFKVLRGFRLGRGLGFRVLRGCKVLKGLVQGFGVDGLAPRVLEFTLRPERLGLRLFCA